MIMRFSGNNGDNTRPPQGQSVNTAVLSSTVELIGEAAEIAETQGLLFNEAQLLSSEQYNETRDREILRSLEVQIKTVMDHLGSDSKMGRPKS